MSGNRHAFRAFSLALMAALGLMALSAAGAQALTQGVFLVAGGAPKAGDVLVTELEPEKVGGKPSLTLLTELAGGFKIALLCEVVTLTETKVVSEKDLEVVTKYTKCKVNEPANCTVVEPITTEALVLALLHKPTEGTESTYIVFEPKPGKTAFTSLEFKGATCTLPTEPVEIKGRLTFKDCENAILTEKTAHLLEELKGGTKLKFKNEKGVEETDNGLKFASRPMSVDGSLNVKVLRGGVAQNWSAH